MPKNRFATPDIIRYDLADGEDWIRVKKELSYGEAQELFMSRYEAQKPDDSGDIETTLDLTKYGTKRIQMWLTEWSFEDNDGQPVDISEHTIAALNAETALEINNILDTHSEKQAEAQKNLLKGQTPSASPEDTTSTSS